MRFRCCTVENFGSHKHLEIDLSSIGLGLIYGCTGSGKSTIPDMPCWILYGLTAKDGAVDEVRSWQSPGEPTIGTLEVELPSGKITVTRIRGKQSQNDLYWTEESSPDKLERGKDIVDTQRKLNQRLGVDPDLYLSGSYFHEFSPSGNFFTAKAKDRRTLFERISDLSLPVKLADSASEARKTAKADLQTKSSERDKAAGRLQSLKGTFESSCASSERWEQQQKSLIEDLYAKAENFEKDKSAKIATLTARAADFDLERSVKVKLLEDKIQSFELDKATKIQALEASAFSSDNLKAECVRWAQAQVALWAEERESKLDAWTAELQQLNAEIKDDAEFTARIGDIKGQLQKLSAQKCGECGGPKSSDKCDALRDDLAALERAQYANKSRQQAFDSLADKIEALQATVNPQLAALEQAQAKPNNFLSQIDLERAKTHSYAEQISQILQQENPYPAQIGQVQTSENPYAAQMATETGKQNPFKSPLEHLAADIIAEEAKTQAHGEEILALEHRVTSLTQLYDLSFELRGELLRKAVRDIEASTNSILERHFDAELRVTFMLDADELDVAIQKSGYDCVYRQLSKGQRQLLKLSFVVSIMKASANRAGVHFGTLFFDEALDGLDSDLKVKAFSLFSELETNHESILLIDHAPEFQNLFSKRYHVTMSEDISEISLEES